MANSIIDKSSIDDPVGLHTLEVIAKANRFNQWMYEQFKNELKGEVLEIGSGIGNVSKLVIADGHYITLSDYNVSYCEILKKNFSSNEKVRDIIQIDLLDPEFEIKYAPHKEKFESIFLLNVIEHISDDRLSIKNCRYLLKENGHLIVLAPAYSWLYCNLDKQLGHHRRYTTKSMELILKENDLEILKSNYFNFTGITGWLLFGKIFRSKMLGNGEMSAFNSIVPLARLIDKIFVNRIGLSIIVTAIKK